MTLTTDIELIEASDLQIDASVIDVSEVESQEDKDFLLEAGKQILTIEAKADFAIKKVVATIQGRANLEKGRVIYEMQRHFGTIATHDCCCERSFNQPLEVNASKLYSKNFALLQWLVEISARSSSRA